MTSNDHFGPAFDAALSCGPARRWPRRARRAVAYAGCAVLAAVASVVAPWPAGRGWPLFLLTLVIAPLIISAVTR